MPSLLKLRLDGILFRKLIKGIRRYQAFSKAQLDERIRRASSDKKIDMFSSLLEAIDPETGEGFTTAELVSESSLLIIAGESCILVVPWIRYFTLTENRHRYFDSGYIFCFLLSLTLPRHTEDS